jgi:hypothetical protein
MPAVDVQAGFRVELAVEADIGEAVSGISSYWTGDVR